MHCYCRVVVTKQMTPAPGTQPVEIVPASPSDAAGAAATLAEAFAGDAHVLGLLPRGEVTGSLTRLWRRIVHETFEAGGHVYLAVGEDRSRPEGVALWEAPESKVHLSQMLPGLLSYARVFRGRIADACITEFLTQRAHPRAPHWYLKALGTLPRAQGTGIGTRLLEDRLVAIDREHAGTYLEASTERLVPYYERFGFASRGPVPCRGTVPAVGMSRPPAV